MMELTGIMGKCMHMQQMMQVYSAILQENDEKSVNFCS